jgi:hypothetical protein
VLFEQPVELGSADVGADLAVVIVFGVLAVLQGNHDAIRA